MCAELKRSVVVLDGGTGTALTDLGFTSINSDPVWSSSLVKTNPDAIKEVHKRYFMAGADIVMTATYQASIEGYIKQYGVTHREAVKLIMKGVELAKVARDEVERHNGHRGYVAASVGPYGATLCDRSEYNGNYIDNMTKQELAAWHKPRIDALWNAKPDLIALETFPSVVEALAILECLKLPMKVSVTFTLKDSRSTAHGEDIREALSAVVQNDLVVASGVNCFNIAFVDGFLEYVNGLDLFGKPLIVKPNGGRYSSDGWQHESYNIDTKAADWISAGTSWVGGCCATGFDDIRNMRENLLKSNNCILLDKSKPHFST